MNETKRGADAVTLKIPRPLYENLQVIIQGTGFRSVTEFAVYVLRDLASSGRLEPGAPASTVAGPAAVTGGAPSSASREATPFDSAASTTSSPPEAAPDRLTPEEVELIRRRLRSLGYL
jgi:hypothetical protein